LIFGIVAGIQSNFFKYFDFSLQYTKLYTQNYYQELDIKHAACEFKTNQLKLKKYFQKF
jgi:hypothetical protein